MLWLWELRDIGIIGVGLLISVLALTQTGIALPLVLTAVYAFLSIRFDGTSILLVPQSGICLRFRYELAGAGQQG